jgi:hypothetical protein
LIPKVGKVVLNLCCASLEFASEQVALVQEQDKLDLRQQLARTDGLPQEKTIHYAIYAVVLFEVLVEAGNRRHEDDGVAVLKKWKPGSSLGWRKVSEHPCNKEAWEADRCTDTTDIEHEPIVAHFTSCAKLVCNVLAWLNLMSTRSIPSRQKHRKK